MHSSMFVVPLYVVYQWLMAVHMCWLLGFGLCSVVCMLKVFVRVGVCVCLWVLSRLKVLGELMRRIIVKESEKLKQWQIILKHTHTHTETEAISYMLQKFAVWFCFYFYLRCRALSHFLFHHLLCLLYSLILSYVWLPVPVLSLCWTGLDDVMAIMRMCP